MAQQAQNISQYINDVNQSLLQYFDITKSTITALNSSIEKQLETQKQQFSFINYNINSLNSSLQNQIDGTKYDIKNIQSSITGISGLINNINNVNAVQNTDIQALKTSTSQNKNGAFWCSMLKGINSSYSFIEGYCPNLKLCCKVNGILKDCQEGTNAKYTEAQCGTFIYI
ncbi:Hypothetical_protein [Hexamita inflata]|uniref:Hypothetical_protein n=1 Tax=Hexamita inflata TaxID=28002 RepID=A0AA86R3W2_9EUKA|nr:Hypothetical protein HINF_LOCUS57635 [Hexamita inflata]